MMGQDKPTIDELKYVVEKLKANGINEINLDYLLTYLSSIENDPQSLKTAQDERYKAELQKWIEEIKNVHAHSVEIFRSVIQAGQNALRTSFLMNGGASVAILAFIGHLATYSPNKVSIFSSVLSLFVVGVLVSTVASGVTYLSQWFYAANKTWSYKVGFVLNIFAIVLGLASYVIFGFGIWEANDVFNNFT